MQYFCYKLCVLNNDPAALIFNESEVHSVNQNFPRIITLLRKERSLSQKSAAEALGISQALLSHYEKGIRECGLDFVVKTAEFYNVSTDYLLGRSPSRTGATITVHDLPEPDTAPQSSLLPDLNKKLIGNSLDVIFSLLQEYGSKPLTEELSAYLSASVYKAFRILYSANEKNPQGMFTVPSKVCDGLADAAQCIAEVNAKCLAAGDSTVDGTGPDSCEVPDLSPELLTKKYPLHSASLFHLIQFTEARMLPKKESK